MMIHRQILLSLLLLFAVGGAAAERPRVVLWLGGTHHDFKAVGQILSDALPRRVAVSISPVWNGDFLESSEPPDLILMYHCHTSAHGVLTDARKKTLLSWIREGVDVVALHASYYSFTQWPDVRLLYGARFVRHGDAKAVLKLRSQKPHPIFAGVAQPLELTGELYYSTNVPRDCDILAHSTEQGKSDGQPSLWTRRYEKGRIVTILPGHWPDNFRQDGFQTLIANSIAWALNDESILIRRNESPR
jgi:type 1 glutamine amidotransferase